MLLETHGRWPLVGAAALIPVTVKAIDDSSLRPLAALLAHQTEEWVWPGGFLPWINKEVIGSEEDEFPLDRRLGLIINVVFGWAASVAAGKGREAPAGLLYVSHLGNAGMHIGWAVRHRRYDPGLATSVATLAPMAVVGLSTVYRDPHASRRALAAGVAAGLALSAALMPAMRRRAARR